jgi:hypothetical protein
MNIANTSIIMNIIIIIVSVIIIINKRGIKSD